MNDYDRDHLVNNIVGHLKVFIFNFKYIKKRMLTEISKKDKLKSSQNVMLYMVIELLKDLDSQQIKQDYDINNSYPKIKINNNKII
jgi:hypothetical protein